MAPDSFREQKNRAESSKVTGRSWRECPTPEPLDTILSLVSQSCPTLCNRMDCSTPGFPVHHQLLELAQTHVHQVGDAIQTSHPLSSPSPPALVHNPTLDFSWTLDLLLMFSSILLIHAHKFCLYTLWNISENFLSFVLFFNMWVIWACLYKDVCDIK